MGRQRGLTRLMELLFILQVLSQSPIERILSSKGSSLPIRVADRDRIDRICQHAAENWSRPLDLAQAAGAAHLSVPAFTRFFKKCTGMTYGRYLAELRIGQACRLLVETDRTVTEVCYASGFANVSTFNRRFLEVKGMTPREFRRQFVS